jgi:hypothetical protein
LGVRDENRPRRTVFLHAAYCKRPRLLRTYALCVGGGWLLLGLAGSLDLGVGRYGESVPLLLIDRGREESGPYPTNARDPHQRGANQHTARTERKVLERSLPADCIQLARLQNRSVANQEKALRNKPQCCSIRQSHHHRGTEIRDQVFCVPAECCSCHCVRRQPSEGCESNDAANEDCFPKQGDRRLYGCSAQCRVHVVHRSRHCRCTDFQ